MGVMACGVLAENNSTADKSYASAGDSGAIPLFAKANILPQNESSFPFNISKCNGRAELSFKCRIDFAKWAGHNYAFTIRVNGRDIGIKNIVGRPVSFKTADGKEIPAVRGNSLLCYYAPDADAIPEGCQYKPVDPAFDALTYSVDISDCIFEGENQITLTKLTVPPPKPGPVRRAPRQAGCSCARLTSKSRPAELLPPCSRELAWL
jgi:hypothetical protein